MRLFNLFKLPGGNTFRINTAIQLFAYNVPEIAQRRTRTNELMWFLSSNYIK